MSRRTSIPVILLVTTVISVTFCQNSSRYRRISVAPTARSLYETIREKRGAAYAGPHPGNGYGQGGVGIPGLKNAIQYAAYNKLLNRGQSHGYGQSNHGRKLTVDEAIGLFGHHTLTKSYPYTQNHSNNNSGGSSYSAGGSSGYHGSSGSKGRGSGYGH